MLLFCHPQHLPLKLIYVNAYIIMEKGLTTKPENRPIEPTQFHSIYQEPIRSSFNRLSREQVSRLPGTQGDESRMEDIQGFLQDMPTRLEEESSLFKREIQKDVQAETQVSPQPIPVACSKGLLRQSKWLSELAVECKVECEGKEVETICRIGLGEVTFDNAGCCFPLNKVSKIKVAYRDYEKSLWVTVDESVNKQTRQAKYRITIDNDAQDDLYLLLARLILQKISLLEYDIEMKEEQGEQIDRFMMKGDVYKKSQVIGQWNLRRLVISDRIESYKNDKCTFQMKNIRQIWTRFDTLGHLLIIKMHHGSGKTELAIPMVNFTRRFAPNNWFYRIYRLLSVPIT